MASPGAEDRQDEAAPLLPEHLSDLTERHGRRMTGDEIRNKHRLTEKDDRFSKRKAAHKAASVTHGSYSPPSYVTVPSHSHGGEGLQVSVCVQVHDLYWPNLSVLNFIGHFSSH